MTSFIYFASLAPEDLPINVIAKLHFVAADQSVLFLLQSHPSSVEDGAGRLKSFCHNKQKKHINALSLHRVMICDTALHLLWAFTHFLVVVINVYMWVLSWALFWMIQIAVQLQFFF